MTQQHRTKTETEMMILRAVAESDGLTRTQIARHLKRAKTPHLIALVDGLVEAGYLVKSVKIFPNGVQGYLYHLHPEALPPDFLLPSRK